MTNAFPLFPSIEVETIDEFLNHEHAVDEIKESIIIKENVDDSNIDELVKQYVAKNPQLRGKEEVLRNRLRNTVDEFQAEHNTDDAIGTEEMLGAPRRAVPDSHIADLANRSIDKTAKIKALTSKQNKLQKLKSKGTITSEQEIELKNVEHQLLVYKHDKFKNPFLHGSNVVDESGKLIDMDKLKTLIKHRPTKLLSANEKIQKTGGDFEQVFNLSLPALKGLVVNEQTNEFVIVDTCPGAGACQTYCYAKKGSYVMFKKVSMSQARKLNFLLNDPKGFLDHVYKELSSAKASLGDDVQLVMRWHDAGDFMSEGYLAVAIKLAKMMPNVKFYAYTKSAFAATKSLPTNFIINWSEGAKPQEQNKVNKHQTINANEIKFSRVVPLSIIEPFVKKEKNGRISKTEDGMRYIMADGMTQEQGWDKIKQAVATWSKRPVETFLTTTELNKMREGPVQKWNVIVGTGDPDDSAKRRDVKGTWLVFH